MTEIEKLRALLAEAVPLNTPCPSCLRTIEEERRGYGREGCADTARRLLVDAAPAEPVNQCDGCNINAPKNERGHHIFPNGRAVGCDAERYTR